MSSEGSDFPRIPKQVSKLKCQLHNWSPRHSSKSAPNWRGCRRILREPALVSQWNTFKHVQFSFYLIIMSTFRKSWRRQKSWFYFWPELPRNKAGGSSVIQKWSTHFYTFVMFNFYVSDLVVNVLHTSVFFNLSGWFADKRSSFAHFGLNSIIINIMKVTNATETLILKGHRSTKGPSKCCSLLTWHLHEAVPGLHVQFLCFKAVHVHAHFPRLAAAAGGGAPGRRLSVPAGVNRRPPRGLTRGEACA